jgi:hypothetical protein
MALALIGFLIVKRENNSALQKTMNGSKNILFKFKTRWQLLLYVEVLLYALSLGAFVFLFSGNLLVSLLVLAITFFIASLIIKPWHPDINKTTHFIDNQIANLEYSTSFLLKPTNSLSNLGMIQQKRVESRLTEELKKLNPPSNLKKSGITSICLILLGFLCYHFNISDYFNTSNAPIKKESVISFQPTDSTDTKIKIPAIVNQSLRIDYPNYTRLKSTQTSTMDISAVEGSRAYWQLEFSDVVSSVTIENMEQSYLMKQEEGIYTHSLKLINSGFYNFKFEDKKGNTYFSDLFAIEVSKDTEPKVEIKNIEQFTQFEYDDNKNITFKSLISDDYGIGKAHIIATVSKGSGESVKFREEQLSFDNSINIGAKTQSLNKTINLDAMKMEPGDELYFYVHATDLKSPNPNTSRSETFFVAIKDTVTNTFGVEGTLGVDRMPDYFRSQRQLIIDTEKLIKKRGGISQEDFNFTSNELGFDQKALRIKYGEFMGEEQAEEEGVISQENLEVFEAENEEHDDHDEEEDLLAKYTHDHDGSNEHNLVDEKKSTETKNPLEEFSHSHDDAEMATLFEESLRSKLLRALSEMWDSELYLRLYKPEESLPYQYKALKLLQDIKNSARIYVHRIGFDPPPIKEDKRLSGKLEDITSYRKNELFDSEKEFPSIRRAINQIEQIIINGNKVTEEDQVLFQAAGNELAQKAIDSPGMFLSTLQLLKELSENKNTSTEKLRTVQKGLFLSIPESETYPSKSSIFKDKINQLLLKELELND